MANDRFGIWDLGFGIWDLVIVSMPDFINKLTQQVQTKLDHLSSTFRPEAGAGEEQLKVLVEQHWHPLPADLFNAARRPALAVDSSIARVPLANGAFLFVAQGLCIGYNGVEESQVEVEILRGNTERGDLKRFGDLLMQLLEVNVASRSIDQLPPNGILFFDGALYSRLPQLYPFRGLKEFDYLHRDIATNYQHLFDRCDQHGRHMLCVAKTSRGDIHQKLWLKATGGDPLTLVIPDVEAIARWTDRKAGYSTPIVLGRIGFSGGEERLSREEIGLADAPAVISFFLRLADHDDALRIEVPGTCVGYTRTIGQVDADVLDLGRHDLHPILAALAADYGGFEVYNALLYSVDREVRLRREMMNEVYLRLIEDILGYELRRDRSDRRF